MRLFFGGATLIFSSSESDKFTSKSESTYLLLFSSSADGGFDEVLEPDGGSGTFSVGFSFILRSLDEDFLELFSADFLSTFFIGGAWTTSRTGLIKGEPSNSSSSLVASSSGNDDGDAKERDSAELADEADELDDLANFFSSFSSSYDAGDAVGKFFEFGGMC